MLGKKILVTGSAGFLGTNFVLELLNRGAYVRGTWHNKKPEVIHERFEPIQVDLTCKQDCYSVVKGMDFLIMTAAYVGGAEKILSSPMEFVTDTTVMNLYLLEAAYRENIKKVVYISSGMVYPECQHPLLETQGMDGEPFEKYYFGGWSRRYLEIVCRMYGEKIKKNLNIGIVRIDNVYGPYDSFSWEKSHVMSALIRKAVERMDPFEVWGNGKDYKDFIYVDDLIEGALLVLDKVKGFEIYNIASGKNFTIDQIIKIILKLEGYENANIVYNKEKPSMIPYKVISIEKAKKNLDFFPKMPLEEGIKRTISWYKNREKI